MATGWKGTTLTNRPTLPPDIHARLVKLAAARTDERLASAILQRWPVMSTALLPPKSETRAQSRAQVVPLTDSPIPLYNSAPLLHRTGAHLLARVWEQPSEGSKGGYGRLVWMLMAVAIAVVIWLAPTPSGLSPVGQHALAIVAAAAVLWLSEAVPIPLTALLVCAAFSVAEVATGAAAFHGFSSPTIFFLLGALTLGVAFEKVGLHLRLARLAVGLVGDRPLGFMLVLFGISFLLPFAIPYHAVAAMFVPVLGATVAGIPGRRSRTNMARLLFMTLAIGSGIGSMASLVGATRNPIALELLARETGRTFGYMTWLLWTAPLAIPLAVCAVGLLWWTLGRHRVRGVKLSAATAQMGGPEKSLGRDEWQVLGVLVLALTGWITVGQHLGLAVVSLAIPALLLATRSMDWYDLERGLPWSLLIYYGGALTIGKVFHDSGLATWLAETVQGMSGPVSSGMALFGFTVAVAVVVTILSQVVGNAAVVAIMLPVALKLGAGMDVNPIATTTVVVMASALSFCLPVAAPANLLVYVRPEIRQRDFVVVGGLVTLCGLGLLCAMAAVFWLVGFWS